MARVALGGTFDPLHDGHKKLLEIAYELSNADSKDRNGKSGDNRGGVVIGLTSDAFARKNRSRAVLSFDARAENLRQYMRRKYGVDVKIVEINDRYGVAIEEDFDYIIVSPETYEVAVKINELRRSKGKKEIKIVKVSHVLAEDGRLLSATRIKRGEIDRHGALL